MKALNLKPWAFLPVFLFFYASQSLAQSICDAPEVKLGNNFIQIAPTGVDDTQNIQCALDLAVERNIPEIRLARGEFFISSLSARNFVGTLQGGGRDHTRLNVLDQSVDCAAIEARGELPAAIKFAGGEPRIRWLTLAVDPHFLPCATGGSWGSLTAMVHFTGHGGSPSDCTADVTYGTIDRVNLEGPRIYSVVPQPIDTGILASPEESGKPECRNSLLGSIRINRSLVDGFSTGARINMRGDAQVSVLNSDFAGNHLGLGIIDSNAVVTVFGNRFASKAPGSYSCCEGGGIGIGVHNHFASTGATRLDIRGNTFNISSGGFDSAWGVQLTGSSGATAMGCFISDNRFQLSGGEILTGISSYGVSGGIVSANRISSYMQTGGVFFDMNSGVMGEADHWTVVSNRGLADVQSWDPEAADIYLGANSSHVLIGPGQAAVVRDEGVENIVLPQ